MSCWAVIPIKAAGDGKSRLAGVLDPAAREALVDAMLAHVVATALATPSLDRVYLVGPSRHGLDEAITLLPDPGAGLNAALQAALARLAGQAPDRVPDRVVVIAADLPHLSTLDLDLLARARDGAIAIAPDRHGTGTNALSLPLPDAAGFTFLFGEDSFARHCAEAERLGHNVETILSRGLEKDIDEPADLADAGSVL
ncbi:2-phospho-L-lactate guanylyltransferase [Novosphingobium album (ex Liu et al. 2023)]|uniref:3-phospho-D-glycerate guanylyltransferase n=1 Tax=Novosphingobium album (ex Liu et al. 2023) TaxID=3031130 RepID=A0ABT5WUG1_9SPHN|nr:2-phospho-L-lactate guanylyltransferase [Novosphingobium album (ex Liu et al. 2023)]MDE8653497.1 2-phospho-L-lactate guanylyltransferase [Novosphingobium album (ex Liu et al. 2023)]